MIMTVSGASFASPASWTSVRDLPVGFIVLPRSAGAPVPSHSANYTIFGKKMRELPWKRLIVVTFSTYWALGRTLLRRTKERFHLAPRSYGVILGVVGDIAPANGLPLPYRVQKPHAMRQPER
jgi:hypothetical protein